MLVTWTCSIARQINVRQNFTNLCPFIVFLGNSYFETQFVCDKAVKLSVFMQYVIFLYVLFTVFEVYSSLLTHPLSVNHDLLHANLVYLYIMNNIYYHSVAGDSYIIGGKFS